MFRRLPSSLPKDPVFPADLNGLGYFINDKDEIRSLENPTAYFKFFLTKNDRYNCVQRESMNEFIRNLIAQRLEGLNLSKIRLPLGAQAHEPHVPIFISSDLGRKQRVIILFYEHTQDLGAFAHRIIGGQGGINAGSAVNFVKYIQSLASYPNDKETSGIILANMGQLRWWRKGKKAMSQTSWFALPQKSAVDQPYRFDAKKNTVEGNRNTAEHVNYVFNEVVKEMVDPMAKLDVIGVSEGAVRVSEFLDQNWKAWENRMEAFATIASWFGADEIKNTKFAEFMKDVNLPSPEPAGTYLVGPKGLNSKKSFIPAQGCPCFSLGEPYYAECMLPKGYKTVLNWLQEVAKETIWYRNPEFVRFDGDDDEEEDESGEGWDLQEDKDGGGRVEGVKGGNGGKGEVAFKEIEMPRKDAESFGNQAGRVLEIVKAAVGFGNSGAETEVESALQDDEGDSSEGTVVGDVVESPGPDVGEEATGGKKVVVSGQKNEESATALIVHGVESPKLDSEGAGRIRTDGAKGKDCQRNDAIEHAAAEK